MSAPLTCITDRGNRVEKSEGIISTYAGIKPWTFRESLDILMETFYTEIEKLRDQTLQGQTKNVNCKALHQSVKALCAILAKIETTEITKAIDRLNSIISQLNKPNDPMSQSTDRDTVDAIHAAIRCSVIEEFEESVDGLVTSVKQLIRMYCQTFHTDFIMGTTVGVPKVKKTLRKLSENSQKSNKSPTFCEKYCLTYNII
ncbi:hypothetical protein LOTGIDRAFT_175770 [Lottia gigantea]|uniref:Uncharacterized protein n=1 Tax=Lottia gigantea TaxID=225164 RepID=V3ZJS5_LOTGI|nr:hypothetical protein LOTGIDRAFT_175770 [Lottia gigantea]ESO91538.1 hypothetical protein LOTGIDRAFT_175770 [Lottia gigantea]